MAHIDPVFMSKVKDLAEKGLNPDEIIDAFRQEDIAKANSSADDGVTFDEKIPDEIKVIAQALAYRDPEPEDLNVLYSLLNASYSVEWTGSQAFRQEGDCVDKSTLEDMIASSEYRWIVVEAPGRSRDDGRSLILGAACFTTSGSCKRNGTVEGRLGSVRFFFVSPEFQRLNVGKRLLFRVEKAMHEEGCVRIMFSIPSTRSMLETWLHNKDFEQVASIPYPALHLKHELVVSDVKLNLFQKPLGKKVPGATSSSARSNSDVSTEDSSDEPSPSSMPPEMQRNTHLPPHWRGIQTSAERELEANSRSTANAASSTSFSMASVSESVGVDIPEID